MPRYLSFQKVISSYYHILLTRKDLKCKPNARNKAKFEFSPLGKVFNQGLDRKSKNYKEEDVIKLLKDIRDKIA